MSYARKLNDNYKGCTPMTVAAGILGSFRGSELSHVGAVTYCEVKESSMYESKVASTMKTYDTILRTISKKYRKNLQHFLKHIPVFGYHVGIVGIFDIPPIFFFVPYMRDVPIQAHIPKSNENFEFDQDFVTKVCSFKE